MLIDEVESFAVRRSLASFETNPVDVQRATDAVLAGCAPRPPRPSTRVRVTSPKVAKRRVSGSLRSDHNWAIPVGSRLVTNHGSSDPLVWTGRKRPMSCGVSGS